MTIDLLPSLFKLVENGLLTVLRTRSCCVALNCGNNFSVWLVASYVAAVGIFGDGCINEINVALQELVFCTVMLQTAFAVYAGEGCHFKDDNQVGEHETQD